MSKRYSTKFPGVQARESDARRYRGRPDICYTIDYRDANGKRVRKDVGWASEGFSAALAAEMRARLINAEKTSEIMGDITMPIKPVIPTFGEAWEKYKKDWLIANGKDVSSPEALVRQHMQKFLTLPLNQISPLELDRLMADMRGKGLAPQTIHHAIALIRRVMRRMVSWKLYAGRLPFDSISLPKPNNSRIRFLTPEEAQKLLAEIKKRSVQTWLMSLVSLHCGLRFGEVAAIRWEHLDFENMSLYIPESKSGLARIAVITSEVRDALMDFSAQHKGSLVFPARDGTIMKCVSESFFRAVKALGLNNGISDRRQKVVFHTLRHTYASWLAKSGLGQLAIADRLGHHSLEMTKRYTHLMDETRKASALAISRMFHVPDPENQ